jgi:uncharacterized protein (DUF4415 family)
MWVSAFLGKRLHLAIVTFRGDAVRVIRFRKASKKEVRSYEKSKVNDDAASRPDDENPEWTLEDFREARPALEVIAEVWGPEAAEMIRRRPGRPAKADRTVNQTLRLDADVLEAYRQSGPGWQARMNQVPRDHMPGGGTVGVTA